MPERRKDVVAVVTAAVSRAARVDVQREEARWTWVTDARERFEARRWGRRVERERDAAGAVEGGGEEEEDGTGAAAAWWRDVGYSGGRE